MPAPVLVVEDDPLVLNAVSELVEYMGYPVLTALNGADALVILKQGRIHMLLADIMMWPMTGITLAQEALSIYPKMPILLFSGYPEQTKWRLPDHCRFLAKPFSLDRLKEVLESMMETVART